jgi:hypothetical protein
MVRTILVLAFSSSLAFLIALPALALAVPTAVPYVGWLTDDSGAPADGAFEVKAELFAQAQGGTAIWSHTWDSVVVQAGLISVLLGSDGSPALDAAMLLAENGTPDGLFLSITLDGTVLAPRQRMLSVPYALVASNTERLGGVGAGDYLKSTDVSSVGKSGKFSDLSDMPAGLADGDADTLAQVSCALGMLLQRQPTGWGCISAEGLGRDTLAFLTCSTDQVVQRNGTDWECGDLTDYSGADFALSMQSCSPGMVVVAIDTTGHLVCEAPHGGLLRVTANDVTPSYLSDKLKVTGTTVSKFVENIGGNELINIALMNPSMNTYFCRPLIRVDNGDLSSQVESINTRLQLGKFVLPFDIVINNITFYASVVTVPGTVRLGIYSEDGQTRYLGVESGAISVASLVNTTIDGVALKSGIYWFAFVPNGTTNIEVYDFNPSQRGQKWTNGFGGAPPMQGYLSVPEGTLPATFAPTDVDGSDPSFDHLVAFGLNT